MKTSKQSIVQRFFGLTVRSIDEKARSVDVVASSEVIDSYEEIVEQDWDLSRFNRNPVVLYGHNSWITTSEPEHTLPIGHAENTRVEGNQLLATICFVDERANPMAERVWQGFLQKSLRAVSVGFWPHTIVEEKRDDKSYLRLRDNELFEISVCPIGANPDAVAKAMTESHEQLRQRAVASSTPSAAHAAEVKSMKTLEQVQAELDALTAAHAALEAKSTAVATAHEEVKAELAKALESETKAFAERDAAVLRADEAEGKLLVLTIDALVGVKIEPCERDAQLELAKKDRPLFDKLMEKRAVMKTLETHKLGSDPNGPNTVAADGADDNGKALAAEIAAKATPAKTA
jgi:HK97 family phage prohead protease